MRTYETKSPGICAYVVPIANTKHFNWVPQKSELNKSKTIAHQKKKKIKRTNWRIFTFTDVVSTYKKFRLFWDADFCHFDSPHICGCLVRLLLLSFLSLSSHAINHSNSLWWHQIAFFSWFTYQLFHDGHIVMLYHFTPFNWTYSTEFWWFFG